MRIFYVARDILSYYECSNIPYDSPFLVVLCLLKDREELLSEINKYRDQYHSYSELLPWISSRLLFNHGRFEELVEGFSLGEIAATPARLGNYILLAEALEHLERYDEARQIWKNIQSLDGREDDHRPQVALVNNYVCSGEISVIGEEGSGVSDARLIKETFENLASSEDLERILVSEGN